MTVTVQTCATDNCLQTAIDLASHLTIEMEWTEGYEPVVQDLSYPPFVTRCPHGATYVARPSLAQVARWVEETAP